MTTILLTIHILIAVALVGTVLLQRNEGGGLGIGGSAGGGFMTARSTANLLTRTTSYSCRLFLRLQLVWPFWQERAASRHQLLMKL